VGPAAPGGRVQATPQPQLEARKVPNIWYLLALMVWEYTPYPSFAQSHAVMMKSLSNSQGYET